MQNETTLRLFDDDPYLTAFEAQVIAEETIDGKRWFVLDQTLFYPESGGQPSDQGTLNGIPVLDVQESDAGIVHLTESPLRVGSTVDGMIDWDLRFDHMQQHSGQHILSQAFVREADAHTRGFHLGAEISTLDLSANALSSEAISKVEALANSIVMQNRSVKVHKVERDALDQFPLRREIKAQGIIRLVEVEDFECTGCCGTHVRRTGDIGLIKVIKTERHKGGFRVTFVCGNRGLKDYQTKHAIVDNAARRYSVSENDLIGTFDKLDDGLKESKARLKAATQSLMVFEAESMLKQGKRVSDIQVVTHLFSEREMGDVLNLLKKMIKESSRVVLLGIEGETSSLLFGRSADVEIDLRPYIQGAEVAVGIRGGGSASLVQGRGVCKADGGLQTFLDKTGNTIAELL